MFYIVLAQWIGWGALSLFFVISLWIVKNNTLFLLSGKTVIIQTATYFFFLIIVRMLRFWEFITPTQAQLIVSLTALVPLIVTLIDVYLATRSQQVH